MSKHISIYLYNDNPPQSSMHSIPLPDNVDMNYIREDVEEFLQEIKALNPCP